MNFVHQFSGLLLTTDVITTASLPPTLLLSALPIVKPKDLFPVTLSALLHCLSCCALAPSLSLTGTTNAAYLPLAIVSSFYCYSQIAQWKYSKGKAEEESETKIRRKQAPAVGVKDGRAGGRGDEHGQ